MTLSQLYLINHKKDPDNTELCNMYIVLYIVIYHTPYVLYDVAHERVKPYTNGGPVECSLSLDN